MGSGPARLGVLMNKRNAFRSSSWFWLILALVGVFLIQGVLAERTQVAVLPYSEFQTLLRDGKVARAEVSEHRITGELEEPYQGKNRFATTRVDEDIAAQLELHGVEYGGQVESAVLPALLSWIVPVLLFAAVWIFVIRRMAGRTGEGGFLAVGKSKAKVYVETDTKVTFDDVAGVDEAKEELREIVEFLKNPAEFTRLGARLPRGILLVGPPGTGKTLLARAVAGEAGVPFFSISGSEFVELFVGVGAARVRDLFEQARKQAPCIIFIDELDALGRARAASGPMGGHDEKEQTLNQLLVELDGFDPASGIVLLAASNRPEILDPALLRAGRFDRQVLVDRPDRRGRAAILRVHLARVKADPALDVDAVAAMTPGFTGADLANLVNEAALLATRRRAEHVTMADFSEAIERVVAGLERKNRLIEPRERRVVAFHEMGHALVSAALQGPQALHKVSIIPRGVAALGYTMERPVEERFLMTREELEKRMAVLLGGRAAEDVIFGHLSTGAADDLVKATEIARSMVTRYGMVPELGHATYDSEPQTFLGMAGPRTQRTYSEETAREIDCAVRRLVGHAFDHARAVLAGDRELLETSAQRLLEHETLERESLIELFAKFVRREESAAAA
jgi:cell division protease FtsH